VAPHCRPGRENGQCRPSESADDEIVRVVAWAVDGPYSSAAAVTLPATMLSPVPPHILAYNPPRYADELRHEAARRSCRLGRVSLAEPLLLADAA